MRSAIPEADIHAFVDGQMTSRATRAMSQRLEDEPLVRDRVAALHRQNEALRATFGPIAAEPLPDTLARHADEERLVARPAVRAVGLAFGLGTGLGAGLAWTLHILVPGL